MEEALAQHVSSATQGRPRGEDIWYSPARDISALVPALTSSALGAWEDDNNEYRRLGLRIHYTDTDVGQVAQALAAFMSHPCVVEADTFAEAYEKSGLAQLPVGARSLVLGMLGEEMLCAFWYAIRAATTKDDSGEAQILQYDPKALAARAAQTAKLFRMPPWRRWIWRRWYRARLWLLRKLGVAGEPNDGAVTKLPGAGHGDQ